MLPINEIFSLLQNSKTGYDVAMDKYKIANKIDNRIAEAQTYNYKDQNNTGLNFLANLAGLAISSDEELKEDIIEVGRLYNGLPVYLYHYRNDNIPRLGLLAQQVSKVNPEAVFVDDSGYLKVNYALACR